MENKVLSAKHFIKFVGYAWYCIIIFFNIKQKPWDIGQRNSNVTVS